VIVLGVAALLATAAAPEAKPEKPAPEVVATVGARRITAAELEQRAFERAIDPKTREYNVKRQLLRELIEAELLSQEAARRGLSVEALLRDEVEAKAVPPTEWDVPAYHDAHRDEYKGLPREQARAAVGRQLREIRVAQRRAGFLASLAERAGVHVSLEPPRVRMDLDGVPVRGPADAPVTIVEFSEFQCPACGRAAPVLKRLLEERRGRLRLAFRHFPLVRHKEAPKAAEAAECAGEQGKFWEMHDRLFADQDRLKVPDLKGRASALGLDASAFGQCLDSGRHAAKWQRDLDLARRYGLTGTPSFFVNGRLVVGALSYEEFLAIIEEELAAAADR
jgi:protein-disulfide isomerase